MLVKFDEDKIDMVFAELDQCHLPGAAVGIAIGGNPVYRKGFGLASMELPLMLSPRIRMRIYSTSKHFTCLAYMLLCEEGRAAIDDELGKYLTELHPVTHHVTMRQLMGNIGGLRDALEINWAFGGIAPRVSSNDLLSLYRDITDVNFIPGTAWRYSNGGFLLLGAVIERITGQSLEQVLWERIFEPVGMNDTLLRRWDTEFVPNSATMHMTKPGGGFDRFYEGAALDGGGGIVSTVDDMLRWLSHMNSPWIGSSATWELMRTPQTLANGTSTGYGLGLFTSHYRGVEVLHHSGGGLGSNAQMLKVPAAGLDIVVMVNRHDVQGVLLANKIVDACLPDLDPAERGLLRPAVNGTFHSPTTGRVIRLQGPSEGSIDSALKQTVSIDGADLVFEHDAHMDNVLRPAAGAYFLKLIVTLIGDHQKPTCLRLDDYGNMDELTPVRASGKADVSRIADRYRSNTVGAQCTISNTDDGPQLRAQGRFGSMTYDLEYLGEELWRAKPTPVSRSFIHGILSFNKSGDQFRFVTHGTLSLLFRRCT